MIALGWASVKQSNVTDPPSGSPTIWAGTQTIGGTVNKAQTSKVNNQTGSFDLVYIHLSLSLIQSRGGRIQKEIKRGKLTFDIDPDSFGNRRWDAVGCDAQISSRFRPSNLVQSQTVAFNRRCSQNQSWWIQATINESIHFAHLLSSCRQRRLDVRLHDAKSLSALERRHRGKWASNSILHGLLCVKPSCQHPQWLVELKRKHFLRCGKFYSGRKKTKKKIIEIPTTSTMPTCVIIGFELTWHRYLPASSCVGNSINITSLLIIFLTKKCWIWWTNRLSTAEIERPSVSMGVVSGAVARNAGDKMLMNGNNHVTIQMDPCHLKGPSIHPSNNNNK